MTYKVRADSIDNARVNSAAAIAQSKIANLTTDLAAKAPLASPTFTGATVSTNGLASADYRRIINPGGGFYEGSGVLTGAIKIKFPVPGPNLNTMFRLRVSVYDLALGEQFDAHIDGYFYNANLWYAENAYIIGSPHTDRNFSVRYGYETSSGLPIVYIGELASSWDYLKVALQEVYVGHQSNTSAWTSGWVISLEASAFENVTYTVSDVQVGRRAPTAAVGTNTTQVATTAYVQANTIPKAAAAANGKFDATTTTPTGTTRLNYGGYFYPTQLNLTGTAATATAATSYYCETGSDGVVRPKTLANVKSEIVTAAAVNASSGSIVSGFLLPADTRAVATTPETLASPLIKADFKQNATEGLSDGGTYFGELTFRPYGVTTDWTGGGAYQLGFTNNANLWMRYGTSTTWGSWKKFAFTDSPTFTGTPAAPTAAAGTNTTQVATTAYVKTEDAARRNQNNLFNANDSYFIDNHTGIWGYGTKTNCTLSISNAYSNYGPNSLMMIASSAANMALEMPTDRSVLRVNAGTTYTFAVESFAITAARSISLTVSWRTAAGASVGSPTTGSSGNNSTSAWTQSTVSAAAPATAAYAVLKVNVASPANAEVHVFDKFYAWDGTDVTWSPLAEKQNSGFMLYYRRTTNQACATLAWTNISYDSLTTFDGGANGATGLTTTSVVPNRNGIYMVFAQVVTATRSGNRRGLTIRVNGGDRASTIIPANGTYNEQLNVSCAVYLNGTSDAISVAFFHDSTGSPSNDLNVTSSYLDIAYLGPLYGSSPG